MHAYRTHTCGELREAHVGQVVRLSGWVHRKRDHGNLLFVDLRDDYGVTQCVVDVADAAFAEVDGLSPESVVTFTGTLVARDPDTVNPELATGTVELRVAEVEVRAVAAEAAAAGVRRARLPRGHPPALPLPGSSARNPARQYPASFGDHRQHSAAHDRGRLHRVPDPDPHRVFPRRGARFLGAEPP